MGSKISGLLTIGGMQTRKFLEYCIYAATLDPVFVCLTRNYQLLPSAPKAIALFDEFCAPASPVQVSSRQLLPPTDFRLFHAINNIRDPIRVPVERATGDNTEYPTEYVNYPHLPAKYLFDELVGKIVSDSPSYHASERQYNPELSPVQNLPGGKMSSAQRLFVEQTWKPIRARLIAAGFTVVCNVG